MQVLIVDDEAIIREGLRAMIPWEEYGFQRPDTAFNGVEALRKMVDNSYDLLITDIRMPVMDGLELSKNVSIQYPNCAIIILSGYGDFAYAQQAIDCGVFSYLLKPVNEEKLEELLYRLKEKKQKENLPSELENRDLFYVCTLPFAVDTGRKLILQEIDGASAVRYLTRGDLNTALNIVKNFVRMLYQDQPAYSSRMRLCAEFVRPLEELADSMDIQSRFLEDDSALDFQNMETDSLAALYEKITGLFIGLSQKLENRKTIRTTGISDRIILYIRDNYREKLTAAEIAEHFHLTPAYLGRRFKTEQGISLNQFLHNYRIELAKQLLADTHFKLEYIAAQVGYSDVSNFYLQFKRLLNMTPEQYRKLAGKDKQGDNEDERTV